MKILSNPRVAFGGLALAALTTVGVGVTAAPANAASASTWDAIAQCESSGNWSIDTGNGFYGGLQFTLSTWHAFGGSGNPANASRSTQIAVAERVLASQGWGAWPACSAQLGLSGHTGSIAATTPTTSANTSTPSSSAADSSPAVSASSSSSSDSPSTPSSSTASSSTVSAPSASVTLSGTTYTVRSGDTLSKIAVRLHTPGGWQSLAAANTATISDPNLIFPGQTLRLTK